MVNVDTALATTLAKQDLSTESTSWAAKARDLRIVDRESCINASHLLRSVKGLEAEVDRWFEPHIEAAMETKRKADQARKALVDERDKMKAPLLEAEGVIKRSLLAWESEQEAVRREQERALQAEAQRLAEVATLEAAAAMELEARATGSDEMLQEAQDILSQPTEAPVVVVKKLMPKMDGISYRDQWKAHPDVSIRQLAAAVASGSVPATFITANMTAINQYARATQGAQPVPGVKFWNDRQIAAKG